MASAAARRIAGAVMLMGIGLLTGPEVFAEHGIGEPRLPGTARLDWEGDPEDFSARMVRGIHRFLDRKLDEAERKRERHWDRDLSSAEAYAESVRPNRERFREIIGLIDDRLPVEMQRFGTDANPALVAEADGFRVFQVRWEVLKGVEGEGLLLSPEGKPTARVVVMPDADQTPEQQAGLADGIEPAAQLARRLAAAGCEVVVPTPISRAQTFSGNPDIRMTNMPHREWIYRQAYQMGRHVIAYELQQVLGAVDWFEQRNAEEDGEDGSGGGNVPIGLAGYGEGGLLALYGAAADERIDATLVNGYFGDRWRVWREPIDRNVWSLLERFGDAELASLIFPRGLQVLHRSVPRVDGPPKGGDGRRDAAAPGRLWTPAYQTVRREMLRARSLGGELARIRLASARPHMAGKGNERFAAAHREALKGFLELLGTEGAAVSEPAGKLLTDRRSALDVEARQKRRVRQIERHVQRKMRYSDDVRDEFFLDKVSYDSPEKFASDAERYRQYFSEKMIGELDGRRMPPNVRTRKVYEREKWVGYEVVLDVWPDVFAWGVLCVPRDIEEGEQRPVVVCQHGLEGLPRHTIEGDHRAYHNYAARLAERGFITFAPHNPYRGGDQFRTLQRKANAIGASLFSVITPQHRRILEWLKGLDYVDGERIGFYGLSYGGKTAMRVPALLEDYALSICSADFNDWIRKNVTTHWRGSYMFTHEWEMPEFDLGRTFNHAEMSYLLFPRPFMVERGHRDGVAPDEWVAYEYAKVRRLYDQMGLGDRAEIEFFNGPHTINGEGTFEFLHEQLDWPAPGESE